MEFPIGKKLFHLVVNPGTSRCQTENLELVQTTRNGNGTQHSVRKFQPGKRAHLFRFSTFSGNFLVGCTAEPKIPEIWTKWKAPFENCLTSCCFVCLTNQHTSLVVTQCRVSDSRRSYILGEVYSVSSNSPRLRCFDMCLSSVKRKEIEVSI